MARSRPAGPADGARGGEITRVGERRHQHHISVGDPAVGHRGIQCHRDADGEQVSALVERVGVALSRKFRASRQFRREDAVLVDW